MIFYRAVDADGLTHILGTQADARAINRDFEQFDFPTDKAGLLVELNATQHMLFELRQGGGTPPPIAEAPPPPPPPPAPISYSIQTCELDRAFLAAPMPQRLTLMAVTLEELRGKNLC